MTKRILDVSGHDNAGFSIPDVIDAKLWNRAMKDIETNNTWCPDVTRIIFNTGTRKLADGKVQNTLATTMFFNDNTKVTCVNSEHDNITLTKDPETGAMVASDVDKERGIVYCTVKKLISKIDPVTGVMKTEGFGRILRELIASGFDQQIEEKRRLTKKAQAKAKYEAEKNKAKEKPARKNNASLYETVNRLADVVEKLDAKIPASPQVKDDAQPKTTQVKKVATKKAAQAKKRPQKRNAKGQFI